MSTRARSRPSEFPRGEHETLSRFLETEMVALGLHTTYALGRYLGVSQGTAWRLLSPLPREFHESTLLAVATAFDVPITVVRRMATQPPGELVPFRLPDEVNQLPAEDRAVITQVALRLLAARGRRMTR
jgi:hypothetical protein